MTVQPTSSKATNIALWVVQIVLALLLLSGAAMKFEPIQKISTMMPWTGQVPALVVRLLGVIDLLGAIGLIIPSLLRIKPKLTPVAAVFTITLMICATIFHISRGEVSVIGLNIIAALLAAFVAWGRFTKAPITSK